MMATSAGGGPFSPSNARTEDGGLIATEAFFPAARCAACHQDTHRAWSQSLHRNAAREPFYRESVDILLRTRGIEPTRHCESCHTPVALFSGVLTKENKNSQAPFTPLDDEGVTCSVCHSITEVRPDGTGSFTIRRPALLAREDGSPIYGNFTDAEILADIPSHKRAVMRPLLRRPEFCSVCHKVTAPPALNGYKQIRGFSAYDEWQQSGASLETVTPFYRREQRADCRACHMPKVESHNDRAAKNEMIASHRWLGANTAAPLFYGQMEQAQLVQEFLQKNVLNVDIFALTSETTGRQFAPLPAATRMTFQPGEEVAVEVVVANRNAAHSFPPEVRDLYEAWVEFEAADHAGRTIFRSGDLGPDGMLDESAHVYKTLILDPSSRPITRHQIWLTNIKAYDNTINAGRSDVVRFRFRMPDEAGAVPAGGLHLRARVNYRRFNQDYLNYVLGRRQARLTVPVVVMAEAEVKFVTGRHEPQQSGHRRAAPSAPISRTALPQASEARRWNDYGIGLLEQAQYGAAAEAFRHASELDPSDSNLLVNAAIAEMRTERFGPQREQLRKAEVLLVEALKVAPANTRAQYIRALVWRGQGKLKEAAEELADVARQYPRDREVQRQLGQTLYTLGRLVEARRALESVLALDPTDANAYQLLSPIYASEGRQEAAARAHSLYLEWRDDPRADGVAAHFFAAHPEWADERVGSHIHGNGSPRRQILTGLFAAPEK
jgi:tetratricopeptide (TPR) repeat protein